MKKDRWPAIVYDLTLFWPAQPVIRPLHLLRRDSGHFIFSGEIPASSSVDSVTSSYLNPYNFSLSHPLFKTISSAYRHKGKEKQLLGVLNLWLNLLRRDQSTWFWSPIKLFIKMGKFLSLLFIILISNLAGLNAQSCETAAFRTRIFTGSELAPASLYRFWTRIFTGTTTPTAPSTWLSGTPDQPHLNGLRGPSTSAGRVWSELRRLLL